MVNGSRLIQVKGGRLKRLLLEIHKLRPDHYQPSFDWKKMKVDERKLKLASFIAMRGFTDLELSKLDAEVFKIRITWIHIVAVMLILVLGFAVWGYFEYQQFSKLQRVYVYRNSSFFNLS